MPDLEQTLLEENARLKKQLVLLQLDRSDFQKQIAFSQREREDLQRQIEEFVRLHEGQQRTIQALQERIKGYIRRIYGKKSEKIDVNQMVFDDIILAAEKCLDPQSPAPHPEIAEEKVRAHIQRKHPGRKPLPPEIPRVEHYLDIPEKEKFTADGKERPIIGVDISEKLDYRPAVFVVNRYIRPKYGADDDIMV
ncbi:MAG: IS66 family transposase zinc-finger binding domain-containing protein [Candidatus Omnitrophota bacterium]